MRKWPGLMLLAFAWSSQGFAALNVFACTPEWGSLAKELGGEKVTVYVATTALQDPHHIEARPSLIARARGADLAVCTGADLEIGWMPLVTGQAGNPRIRIGQPGYFEASRYVKMLEVPERADRAMGDVHPQGNPHIHLDPRNIALIARALGERMIALDGSAAESYRALTARFLDRWQAAMERWEKEAAPLKGLRVVAYHKNLTYLNAWLGIREVGNLEPKPGLPPTAAHLGDLLARLQKEPAHAIVRVTYNEPRAAQWLAEQAKLRVVVVPFTVGGSNKAVDLFTMFDDTLERLRAVSRQ